MNISSIKNTPPVKTNCAIPTLKIDKIWAKGYTGKNITVAVIDSGIYMHPDLKDKVVAFKDFVYGIDKPYDDFGHGTLVASQIGGTGLVSGGKYKGSAPGCNLIGLKIMDKAGEGTEARAIQAIQWILENKEKYNIRVVNISLGSPVETSYKKNPLNQAIEEAVKGGLIFVISAGNRGPFRKSINCPGNDPSVITVGAADDAGTADTSDDSVWVLSSRGPTYIDNLNKPDLVAPGVNNVAVVVPGSKYDSPENPHIGKDYVVLSGTSLSAPLVAGLIADLLSRNPNFPPEKIKEILKQTAKKIKDYDINIQGSGQPDGLDALNALL